MKRLGLTTSITLLGATCWSVLLIAGAILFPAYSATGEEVPSVGAVTQAPAAQSAVSLTGFNGAGPAAAIALPLLVTLAVGIALWLHSRRGAVPVAWTLAGLLAAFNLILMASVGLFILPVTVALIMACCTCRPEGGQRAPAATAGERTA